MPTEPLKKLVFHLDCNFVSLRLDFVRQLLETVASLGYRAILWELENQVQWETCPECAVPDSWNKAEFREILAYSRTLNLEPIPLLQTIGHGEYVMSHERYHAFREHPEYSDCYCVSNPAVRRFLKKWIDEICDLFGSIRHFHLGGDEAYRFGTCKHCAARERNDLYAEHLDDLAAGLQHRRIRPGIWHDMILSHPETVDRISTGYLIWDWNYTAGIGKTEKVRIWGVGDVTRETLTPEQHIRFPEILDSNKEWNPFYTTDFLINRGYDVVLCSAARSSQDGPFCPNISCHADNIAAVTAKVRTAGLAGHCVTSWALRLNPVLAGIPLLHLPVQCDRSPQFSLPDIERTLAVEHFGFAEGWEGAKHLSACDYRVRIFSAIQWSGLKDSRPAPAHYLRSWIKRWLEEDEPFWPGRNEMLDAMIQSTQSGLAILQPHASQTPLATLWVRAGLLQLQYLRMLRELLSPPSKQPTLHLELETLREEMIEFYSTEQTTASACKNAALILDPLLEYLEDRQ